MCRKEKKKKKKKTAAIFHKCMVPFWMLLVQPAAGVSGPWKDRAVWFTSLQGSEQWWGTDSLLTLGGAGGDW